MTQNLVGVDVSKDALDAHRRADGAERRFANSKAGLRALITWSCGAAVAFEPSGRYHHALERALGDAGIDAVKINPLQARRFAEATGARAKTDRVDARLLADMAARLELEPTPARGESFMTIRELRIAHHGLIKDRTAAKNRAKGLTLAILRRQNAARLRQIEAQIKAVEAEIDALIDQEPSLADRRDILLSIPGVSTRTAVALLIDAPELGELGRAEAASLAGLAPYARQSGQWTGRAAIRGGRAMLREALYMPALVAARFNPDLTAFYDRLKRAGKPGKVAIAAVMRKLLLLANALLRDGRKWTPRSA